MIKTSTSAAPAATAMRPGGELIKTAAAGTRDNPAARGTTVVVRNTVNSAQAGEDDPPRSGTAMLLAALALMSGIALRRYGANRQ